MINPNRRDEAAISEIRKSFQKELLTLKTFRHPNIIVLYGYSLNANSAQQHLVYEHATNGSLAGFFTDDGNRARLAADTRLSIMFKLVRAVHFLHTGGCKVAGEGWYVFHRDIKSANICLMDDFTPLLIDCGLAIFVCDDNSRATPRLQSTTGGFAFGTPGYMCPVYVKKKGKGHPCPYIVEYDVYSIGVVLVELILGCLNGGQSMRNDSQFHDVFDIYVQDERSYQRIVDGCEKLKRDADPFIIWNPDGHALCTACIVDKLGDDNGCDFLCLIKECSSKLPVKRLLYGRIPQEAYDRFLAKGEDQMKLDECLRLLHLVRSDLYVVHVGVENTNELLQKQQQMLQRLAKGLNRSLAALALLSSNQFKECPNLVWWNPISVEKEDRSTPKKWIRDKVLQRSGVVFICALSGEPGHEAFEIEVPRRWIVKFAPWLKLCLQAIKAIATSQGLPFPISDLKFVEQYELMKAFLDSAVEKASNAVLAHCEALSENDTVSTIEASGQMHTLAGDAFKFIAKKARANTNWKARMVPICRHNGTPIWVKCSYEAHYEV
ncbi:serine/threonine kinase [Fragilaria crotonensis]|nr:serine/threonine kinase [Fragilaria crotonensis]